MTHVTSVSRIGAAGLGLLVAGIFGQPGVALLERQFARSDSAVAAMVGRPETRMKEIAPAESLFQACLSEHPELLWIIRTNSKGLVVNALSREDTAFSRASDVSDQPWYALPQKTLKAYFGPPQSSRGKPATLFWSRPIRVKNNEGMLRFGGVVVVKINVAELCRRFSGSYGGPFQILLNGKVLYRRGSDSSALMEEKTVRVSGVTGLTCRLAAASSSAEVVAGNKDSLDSCSMKKQDIHRQSPVVSATGASQPAQPETAVSAPRRPFPSSGASDRMGNGLVWKMRWLGTIVIILIFITVLFISRNVKKRAIAKRESEYKEANVELHQQPTQETAKPDAAMHDAGEAAPQSPGVQTDTVEELPRTEGVSIIDTIALEQPAEHKADAASREEEDAAIGERARAMVHQEIKRDIMEKEISAIRNAVIGELKADIRQRLEKNEAEAIRDALRQEIIGALRAEIQDKYYAALREKELENLVKIIREKLVEKEMPLLVEQQRSALSKEIRDKMAAAFTQQIEERQRSALKAEIVKKLELEEYPRLLREERDKLRLALSRRLADNEAQTLEAQAREEMTARIRTGLLSETEAVEKGLREEMTHSIREKLIKEEELALIAKIREETIAGIRGELLEKEQQAIHDKLLDDITHEQRRRIETEELQPIIEAERTRIAREEAPALREQVKAQLRDEELEAMHGRVKAELYAETVEAIRASMEEKYAGLLETRMAQYRDQAFNQAYADIRRAMEKEYRTLIDHVERLSRSMTKVEALDSLSQTITLLTDEKKKYKYFNLNSAQTESLLEYLKRVQSRFNIFLDKADESVREMELKINSVMNKLSGGA